MVTVDKTGRRVARPAWYAMHEGSNKRTATLHLFVKNDKRIIDGLSMARESKTR
jgi:hypothetical protein